MINLIISIHIINMTDNMNDYDHPFWNDFTLPKDKLTDRYLKVLDLYEDRLPANFYLIKELPESFALPILDVKKSASKPIKKIPSFKKLIDKEYETESSKSDETIVKHMKFFTNHLPSFKKYKDKDDLSWVIKENRLLTLEIFEYYSTNPKISLTTIEGRFVGILRIFRIAYETKQFPLYQKISLIMDNLRYSFRDDEQDNKLNEREEKAYVPFEVILEKQKSLEEEFKSKKTYSINQDLLLVSLYSLIPIERDENKLLSFTTTLKTDDDYIYFNDDDEVILLLNKMKKKHTSFRLNISNESPELAKILKESYKLFPRKYVLTNYDNIKEKAKISNLSKRLLRIFKYTGKNVGTNSIRSSYVTWLNENKRLTMKEKKSISTKMRTSVKYLEESYNKILTSKPIIEKTKIEYKQDETTPNTYDKQLLSNKKYYEKNKEEIKERHKENYKHIDKTEQARKKILYYLNNDKEYYKKIKEQTIKKYNIQKKNDIYI